MLLDKIDVTPVVADHVDTLRDSATGKRSWLDIILFFGVPLGLSAFAVWKGIRIRATAITAILTASAIFVGLLPNLLVLVLTFLMNTKSDSPSPALQRRKVFMRQIAAHVSFSFVLSLALASIAAGSLVMLNKDTDPAGGTLTFLMVFASVTFLLTMLMLIRRMYALVVNEFDHHKITLEKSEAVPSSALPAKLLKRRHSRAAGGDPTDQLIAVETP
jgi:hypothetical protein